MRIIAVQGCVEVKRVAAENKRKEGEGEVKKQVAECSSSCQLQYSNASCCSIPIVRVEGKQSEPVLDEQSVVTALSYGVQGRLG